ncbi:hypothetical protein [Magnetofaba australis]|uniref:Uncharacterized protein n=1 Tax=Magnetofaba australis IT-1 TaxID=1434232 RepID=A0A1Y2K9I6_9PROT|nr:hypothetical protein [Magnetofaba australis]OSM07346.1 hypothetical protein MAIT1_04432 [Magnetofaba australis IT-1]
MSNQIPSNITDDAYADEIEGGFRAMLVGHNADGSHKANIDAVIGAIYAETSVVAYVSSTQFTVVGDVTATYIAGRAINAVSLGANVWSHVVSASFDGGSGLTTVTVSDAVIPSDLQQILYGIITDERQLPEMGFLKADGSEPSTGLQEFQAGIQTPLWRISSATNKAIIYKPDGTSEVFKIDLNTGQTSIPGYLLMGAMGSANFGNGGSTEDPSHAPTLWIGDPPPDQPWSNWFGAGRGFFVRKTRWGSNTWHKIYLCSLYDGSRIEIFDQGPAPTGIFTLPMVEAARLFDSTPAPTAPTESRTDTPWCRSKPDVPTAGAAHLASKTTTTATCFALNLAATSTPRAPSTPIPLTLVS